MLTAVASGLRALAAMFAICASGAGSVALAAGLDEAAQVRVIVRARIEAACGFAKSPDASVAFSLDRPRAARLPFTLDCNTPFEFSLESENGALRRDRPVADGFAHEVDYTAAVELDGYEGAVLGNCRGAAVVAASTAGCLLASGRRVEFAVRDRESSVGRQGAVVIAPVLPTDRRLAAGAFSDTLTITVFPRS